MAIALPSQDGELHLCLRAVMTRILVTGEFSPKSKDLHAFNPRWRVDWEAFETQLCHRDAIVSRAKAGAPSDRTPRADASALRAQAGELAIKMAAPIP